MNVPNIIIAVDGYSSTGKSTFAKLLAKELGFLYLDSGALYRGVTLFALENGYFAEDGINFSDFRGKLKGLVVYGHQMHRGGDSQHEDIFPRESYFCRFLREGVRRRETALPRT